MDDLVERLRARAEFEDARVLKEVMRDGFEPVAYTGSESGRMLREAADALEAVREDAERYRWLRMMAKEQLLNPKAAASECPDMRTYWRIPTLICSGPVGGFIDFDAAIDAAREARNG